MAIRGLSTCFDNVALDVLVDSILEVVSEPTHEVVVVPHHCTAQYELIIGVMLIGVQGEYVFGCKIFVPECYSECSADLFRVGEHGNNPEQVVQWLDTAKRIPHLFSGKFAEVGKNY
ncbi:MAG: hypothetical protein ACD_81C00142G0001 [uncultured bacterium]|nr:MAG: hypothetical protein ACD_81C00142G0001 [uncultured bacterium]